MIKITLDHTEFAKEIKTMKRVSKYSNGRYCCPQVISYGMAIHKCDLMAWVLMPRYGHNLEYITHKMSYKLSKTTILDIGTAMLMNLETVHKAGYVFNDLKLENLMVGCN